MSNSHQSPPPAEIGSSVAVVGRDDQRRKEIAGAASVCQGVTLKEYSQIPSSVEDAIQMLDKNHDIVILDVDGDREFALSMVENLSADETTAVMVYSSLADLKLAIRFMRAGAREFFTLPMSLGEMEGALTRAAASRSSNRTAKRTAGKVDVFFGSKGGCGVTTIAANFALSLAQESSEPTLLIDLGLPLGDVGINLGMVTEYSTYNALQDSARLDTSFLNSLLAKHSTGLSVLAAPTEFPRSDTPSNAINRLLEVARLNFEHIVIDIGSRLDLMDTALFDAFSMVYLVTQAGVSELRNANRMITKFFIGRTRNLQIVLNRFDSRTVLFTDKQIAKALTRPTQWKIPDDYATARRTQTRATPLALEESRISHAIRQMAREAAGLPEETDKKKMFSFFK
jgi:pilus assembly protein CpaE